MPHVAIQGIDASFHDIAARKFFDKDVVTLPCDTFAECFEKLTQGEAEYAVVAIENSLYGSISDVYDLLLKHHFWICGEVYVRVAQCLLGLPGAKPVDIKEVHSHPVALAQCEEYLDATLPHAARFEHHDTAGSAADVVAWNDPTKAAIASREAAGLYGLRVLAEEIETNKQNYTRFVVLRKRHVTPEHADKTSLVLTTDSTPGSLHRALGAFAERGIRLTKLQSRPIIGKPWQYMFYTDAMVGALTPAWRTTLAALRGHGCDVRVLGSYQAQHEPSDF